MNNKFFYIGGKSYTYDWLHFLNQYQGLVRPQDIILEIGSSHLKKTKQLAKSCKQLIGLEKNRQMIVSKSKLKDLNVKIVNGDWADLNKIFKDKKFDLIVASHVIEHVENDITCLDQAFDRLKINGAFLFTTPNRLRFSERLRTLFKGARKFPYHEHLREYTENDLKKILAKSKFKDSKIMINGFVFGIHGGSFYIFLKHVPRFLRQWVNFWEVIIQKE